MTRILMAALAASLLTFSGAWAQQRAAPVAPTAPPPVVAQPRFFNAPQRTVVDPIDEGWRHHLTRLSGYVSTPETDRANRVADLIHQGRCGDAQRLADSEHDTLMAAKVPAVCEAVRKGDL